MNFDKEKENLDRDYLEHQNEEEVYMRHIWEEFNEKKKDLEKFVEDEFEKVISKKFPKIFERENLCKLKYDPDFRYFRLKIKLSGLNYNLEDLKKEIEPLNEKYFIREILLG